MDRLPQDALVAILSRLAPRSLAASRCVCKDWRATIDARCKLRADLLPISLGGIFVWLADGPATLAFFGRPSMARRIAGKLEDYVETEYPHDFPYIINSCNGLLLLYGRCVVNPATRQWACLPPYPPSPDGVEGIYEYRERYLLFNPYVPRDFEFHGSLLEGTEWPPSSCVIQVFSSMTGRWEQRSFVLEGDPAATIADVKSSLDMSAYRHAVYWRETLYVHCKGDFLMRLKLSDDNYQVIKPPIGTTGDVCHQLYLGKSKNGVYLALVDGNRWRLQIWYLNEFGYRTEWVLKNSISLVALQKHYDQNHDDGAYNKHWILQDGNHDTESKEGPIVKTDFDWNSDDDNALEIEDWDPEGFCGYEIFGFHPYKEIIFLYFPRRVMAYHFNSSKYQDLGELDENCSSNSIETGFICTPCWIGELSGNI